MALARVYTELFTSNVIAGYATPLFRTAPCHVTIKTNVLTTLITDTDKFCTAIKSIVSAQNFVTLVTAIKFVLAATLWTYEIEAVGAGLICIQHARTTESWEVILTIIVERNTSAGSTIIRTLETTNVNGTGSAHSNSFHNDIAFLKGSCH